MLNAISPPGPGRPPVACREIVSFDLPALAGLLAEGFPARSVDDWLHGLQRLASHEPPLGSPRFGYVLTHHGEPVGVLLLIHAIASETIGIRANVSSWYVRPDFRPFAAILNQHALRRRTVSYVNISAAPHTWPLIEVLGFRRVSSGLFLGAVLPQPRRRDSVVRDATAEPAPAEAARLLDDHVGFGCIALWVETSEGCVPFIFRRRILSRLRLPCAMLIYCPSIDLLERFAAPLSSALLARRLPFLLASVQRPVRGFVGAHFPSKMPIYIKGDARLPIGDLSYTELAILGA